MHVRHQFTTLSKLYKGSLLEYTRITIQQIKDLWLEYHISCIDRSAIASILLTERLYSKISTNVKHTLILRHLHGCQCS